MAFDTNTSRLLALPDPCLLRVMQRCADHTHSALHTATASSRLHQAAVEAVSSVSAGQLDQAWVDSMLLYLAKHGQFMSSLDLRASSDDMLLLRELPPSLTKLDSLCLSSLDLSGTQGVLRAGFPLTRMELSSCRLLDGAQGLSAALIQLPDLQHLSVCEPGCTGGVLVTAQALALSTASQLTCLLLSGMVLAGTLAGRTQLQHLSLQRCGFAPGAGGAQLLSELQHLTQLTHLDLSSSCCVPEGAPSPAPTAYASLTASSKLQHLDFSHNTLPAAAWQYMCPPSGRTLPQLRHLDIRGVMEADGGTHAAPDTSALVSCCPGLQSLNTSMPCSTAQLAPLQRLTSLRTLSVGTGCEDFEGEQALCQLTGLQELEVSVARATEARALQLTQLTRLTALTFPAAPSAQSAAAAVALLRKGVAAAAAATPSVALLFAELAAIAKAFQSMPSTRR
jgi:hypothetical protein